MGYDTTIDLPSNYVPTRSRTELCPSQEVRDCLTFGVILLVVVLGTLGFVALFCRVIFLDTVGPSFYLKSVSVSSLKFLNDSDQQMSTSKWFLNFYVDLDYIGSSFTYQHINVSVHYPTGTSTVAVVPPSALTDYLTATIHAPLPGFNIATYVEMPFDVQVHAKLKYKNWLHINPKKHRDGITNAICKSMMIGINPYTLRGTLVGGPYRCYDG